MKGHNYGICKKCKKSHIRIISEEMREKLRLSRIGKYLSDETKRKIGLKNKGKISGMKGKHLSEETKLKISLGNKGKILSEETKKKIGLRSKLIKHPISSNRFKIMNLVNHPMKNPLTVQKMVQTKREKGQYFQNSVIMRRTCPGRFVKNPSKPQIFMCEQIKKLFPDDDVKLNYPVKNNNNGYYLLDVAVPRYLLNFEYDGKYWHSFKDRIISDQKRDNYLSKQGWNIIRIRGD